MTRAAWPVLGGYDLGFDRNVRPGRVAGAGPRGAAPR